MMRFNVISNRSLEREYSLLGDIVSTSGDVYSIWYHQSGKLVEITAPVVDEDGTSTNRIYLRSIFRNPMSPVCDKLVQECFSLFDSREDNSPLVESMYSLMAEKGHLVASNYSYYSNPVWKNVVLGSGKKYTVQCWSEEDQDWIRDEMGEPMNINSEYKWNLVGQSSMVTMLVIQ